MSLPISARALNLHPDHCLVVGTNQLGVAVAGDIETAGGIGVRIKSTLGSQYTFSLAPRSSVDPTGATDLCRKSYVDALVNGLTWKQAVAARAIGNLASLAGLIAVDGYTLLNGDRVLVPEQTTASANGIYIAASGSWTRATDYATGVEASGATVHVRNGTVHANTTWTETAEGAVNTVSQVWALIQGATVPTAGNGLLVTGTTWSVKPADTSLTVDGTGVFVRLAGGADGLALAGGGGLIVDITGTTAETVPSMADEILIYDASATALRKMTRSNFLSGSFTGSTRFAAYTITGTDVTNKSATITGVGGNIAANHIVYWNGIMLETTDATINTTSGLLSWTGLTLDGRMATGDIITVWGHL